nr:chymotrypsinogen B-like [Rhipicephalus microplus]
MTLCLSLGPSSWRETSLDYLLFLTSILCFQHSSYSASCHLQLQRNFTLNESPPLVQMPVVELNSPGCGGHATFSETKSGSRASTQYLPWMVLLVTRTLSGVYRYCSGTIITERHVLTAGHCTFYTKEDPVSSIKVYYGMKGLKGPYKQAARFLRHPRFDISSLRNDIAILMVDKCFALEKNTASVCLPVNHVDMERKQFSEVYWQVEENGAATIFADILSVYKASSCRLRLGDTTFESRASFCGTGAATCRENQLDDSAGPVFTRGTNGRTLQVGILSYSADCASRSATKVFTRLDVYVPWIQQNIAMHEKYEPLLLAVL